MIKIPQKQSHISPTKQKRLTTESKILNLTDVIIDEMENKISCRCPPNICLLMNPITCKAICDSVTLSINMSENKVKFMKADRS